MNSQWKTKCWRVFCSISLKKYLHLHLASICSVLFFSSVLVVLTERTSVASMLCWTFQHVLCNDPERVAFRAHDIQTEIFLKTQDSSFLFFLLRGTLVCKEEEHFVLLPARARCCSLAKVMSFPAG